MITLTRAQFIFDNKEPYTTLSEDQCAEMSDADIKFEHQCEQEHYELEMERNENENNNN